MSSARKLLTIDVLFEALWTLILRKGCDLNEILTYLVKELGYDAKITAEHIEAVARRGLECGALHATEGLFFIGDFNATNGNPQRPESVKCLKREPRNRGCTRSRSLSSSSDD
uniref:Uncharacterized protein n=1 Tax=Timema bartmani TaxID=61472 RepID=A0A7R9I1D8_9NEOP|nr:unnamed protein product [Timema bartmani]